jgi:peptidoglycan/xylan/chitin deacetylase (PgdA/CDA1 family)
VGRKRSSFLKRPVVLAYHGVGPPHGDAARLLITLDRLESQIRFLQRRGYRFRTAEELADGGEPGPGIAVLTFDDGFRTWLTDVAPLLRRLGVRGTFYVSTGLFGAQHWRVAGDPGRFLTEAETGELAETGMELGSHTVTHPDLRLVEGRELAFELTESKAAVERVTGRPCRTLAYPYGLHDERVESAAAEAGYELAFTWLPGPWQPLAAPRLPAPARHGALGLALKLPLLWAA